MRRAPTVYPQIIMFVVWSGSFFKSGVSSRSLSQCHSSSSFCCFRGACKDK